MNHEEVAISRNQSKNILVVLEHDQGKLLEVSIELTCKARELAEQLGVAVDGVILGSQNDLLKISHDHLYQHGMDHLYIVKDERLARYTSIPFSKAVSTVVRKSFAQIVLFGATTNGRDMAPRVASELNCGLTADCTDLQIGNHQNKEKNFNNILLQIRPAFGGNIIATIISPESYPSMATVREGVMKISLRRDQKLSSLTTEEMVIPFATDDFMTEIIDFIRKERSVDLKKAKVIVAAGMGASDPESIAVLKNLADTLGGELGASRPIVDAGLLSKDHQVGQTGITVRPNLYIACGISGQIQHCAGMQESKRILAINKDPNAPIFKVAHYGIVGNLLEVVPKIISAYKEK